ETIVRFQREMLCQQSSGGESCAKSIELTSEIIESQNNRQSLPRRTRSRRCHICFIENPLYRAVFTACGHCACLACALQMSDAKNLLCCPFCRARTQFVKLIESV
ncbi:hypothetical protein PFISCL1PPCAC_11802, partial [Pristionchus fissidentatus]